MAGTVHFSILKFLWYKIFCLRGDFINQMVTGE